MKEIFETKFNAKINKLIKKNGHYGQLFEKLGFFHWIQNFNTKEVTNGNKLVIVFLMVYGT